MKRMRHVLLVALALATTLSPPWLHSDASLARAAGEPAPAATEKKEAAGSAPALNGVDFTGLKPEQTTAAMQILNETRCVCGCGMTLAECRVKDPNCSRSLALARGVVQDFKDGKDAATAKTNLTAALAKAATPPPAAAPVEDPNQVFKIDVAGAPFKGPKTAPVTIVEFSDYQ
jgi:hypothetical protein